MKKLLALILTAVLCLCFLASCDISLMHSHVADEEWSINAEMHYKNVHCSWNICKTNVISYEHIDGDGDLCCDECGFLMSVASNEIEWQHSDTHHWWIPQSEEGALPGVVYGYGEHENLDADLYCDICGYLMTGGQMALRDQIGAEWLYDITADDIAELKMIREPEGVGPGSYRWVASSTLTAPISRIFEEFFYMSVTPVSKDEAIVPGGSNLYVEFILKDGTKKEFVFYDGCYHDIGNDRYYRLDYYPTFNDVPEYTSYCQFVTIGEWDKCEIWYDDPGEPYFVCDIPLEELKFNVFNGNIGAGVSEYPYFIETDFGRLGFVSNDVFFIVGDGTYYQLMGKDLDEFVEEYYELTE